MATFLQVPPLFDHVAKSFIIVVFVDTREVPRLGYLSSHCFLGVDDHCPALPASPRHVRTESAGTNWKSINMACNMGERGNLGIVGDIEVTKRPGSRSFLVLGFFVFSV